ncbi:MAG: hypothetical protein IPJ69_07920 [Deltaproteobacteria bacterium]|nr:MAG: hypothetical protein IPJ69_07920 [Deltaproteobacteria bacterium]
MAISFTQRVVGLFTGNTGASEPTVSIGTRLPTVIDSAAARSIAEVPPTATHPLFLPNPAGAYRSEPASQRTFDKLITVIRNKTLSVEDRRCAATEYMEMMNRVRDERIYPSDNKAITLMLHFFNEASKDPNEEPVIRAFFDVRIQFSGIGLRDTFTHEDLSLFHSIIQDSEARYIRPTMIPLSEPNIPTPARAYQNTQDGKIYYDQNEVGRCWFRNLFKLTVINVQHDRGSSRSQWESIHNILEANPHYAGEQTWGPKGFAAGSTVGTLTFIAGAALAAPPLALVSGVFFALGFGAGIAGKVSDHFRGSFEPIDNDTNHS